MQTRRVAFVVQRYGEDVAGGAETLCRNIAERLATACSVEVITTCAKDYMTWRNHFPQGTTSVRGVTVHRFPVRTPRNVRKFDALSRRLAPVVRAASESEQREWLLAQGPDSPALLDFIERSARNYDAVFFFTYLYATTYFGAERAGRPFILVPFAHDEWPIYFSVWKKLFHDACAVLFSTPEERQFLERHFGGLAGPVIGSGVEIPPDAQDAAAFREATGLREPFLLYVGRVDESKGCLQLARDFIDTVADGDSPLRLVFAGTSQVRLPTHPRIVELGWIDEASKWGAIRASNAVVVPSRYESLSLALLEAWACAKPAIVNAESPVLVGQCRRANGGLWYSNAAEFGTILRTLTPEIALGLGRQGREYVQLSHKWSIVEEQYRALIEGCAQ